MNKEVRISDSEALILDRLKIIADNQKQLAKMLSKNTKEIVINTFKLMKDLKCTPKKQSTKH